jgi:prevent-host-death family protein
MRIVNIHEAKTHLSRLVEEVGTGQEIVIARAGKPVARLVPVSPSKKRQLGKLKGKIKIDDETFDAPLPKNILRDF